MAAPTALTLWNLADSISETKKDLSGDEGFAKAYVPFVINRHLAYFPDTVLLANEMNRRHHISPVHQYAYLLNTVRQRKRRTKWAKKQEDADVSALMTWYGVNASKAKQIKGVLSDFAMETIRKKMNTGGIVK